jgi:hypothetical protein
MRARAHSIYTEALMHVQSTGREQPKTDQTRRDGSPPWKLAHTALSSASAEWISLPASRAQAYAIPTHRVSTKYLCARGRATARGLTDWRASAHCRASSRCGVAPFPDMDHPRHQPAPKVWKCVHLRGPWRRLSGVHVALAGVAKGILAPHRPRIRCLQGLDSVCEQTCAFCSLSATRRH